MSRRSLGILVALLVMSAGEAAAQTRCYVWRDGRRVECNSRERDRERDRDHARRVFREPVQFGVRGGFDFEEEVGSAGAQIRIPVAQPILLAPSADVFFDESDTQWQINADVLLRPVQLGGVYGGVGAAFVNGDFDGDGDNGTETGLNLLVGLDGGRIATTTLRPFVEARWTNVDDYDAFRLVAGFNVPISGWR
ncbi:MAG TPA: hypothetical protein VF625_08745 [Longimicrobium sp.]